MNLTIVSDHNSSIVGLHQQLTQIGDQLTENSKYNNMVLGFNNTPVVDDKENEMKLYTPVETFNNYSNTNIRPIIPLTILRLINLISIVSIVSILIILYLKHMG